MEDKKTISNQVSEINAAAKHLGVEPIAIYLAKHETKSNDRQKIYDWVNEKKGSSVGVII